MKRLAEFKLDGANIDCRVLAKNNLRLILALEEFEEARFMCGPEAPNRYIRNHERAHKELEQILRGENKSIRVLT